MTARWALANARAIALDRPRIVAILNLTPDSFHAPGPFDDPRAVVERAEAAVAEGADAIELGGESTRPGATRVGEEEQARRVLPALAAIRRSGGRAAVAPIVIDTTLGRVAERALGEGADAINDVSAGMEDARLVGVVARAGAGLVLMHRLRPPGEDAYSDRYGAGAEPSYGDVVAEVGKFLRGRACEAMMKGVEPGRIVVDPGLGFGKTVAQNLELIDRTPELARLGYPIMSALSRKSFVGRASGRETMPADRLAATLALSVVHQTRGASVFRVHDVRAHADALAAAFAARSPGVRDTESCGEHPIGSTGGKE